MLALLAGWQSGYAAACKAVDAGSIPTPASNHVKTFNRSVNGLDETKKPLGKLKDFYMRWGRVLRQWVPSL